MPLWSEQQQYEGSLFKGKMPGKGSAQHQVRAALLHSWLDARPQSRQLDSWG